MSITVYTYNDKVLVNSANDKWLKKPDAPPVDPYNPLGLPEKTMRFEVSSSSWTYGGMPDNTVTQISDKVWDITFGSSSTVGSWSRYGIIKVLGFNGEGLSSYSLSGFFGASSFSGLQEVGSLNLVGCSTLNNAFSSQSLLTSIGNINAPDVTTCDSMCYGDSALVSVGTINTPLNTNANQMFRSCTSLTEMPDVNTASVTNATSMFDYCPELKSIRLIDTSSMTSVPAMFRYCFKVESGALALYQQMSTQTTPPSTTSACFTDCGSNTVTGAAELAQIPSTWGGNGA